MNGSNMETGQISKESYDKAIEQAKELLSEELPPGMRKIIEGMSEKMKPIIANCFIHGSSLSHEQWGDFLNELHQLFEKYGVVEMQNADIGPLPFYERDGWGINDAKILLRQCEELPPSMKTIMEGMSEDESV